MLSSKVSRNHRNRRALSCSPEASKRLGLVFFAPVPAADIAALLEQHHATKLAQARQLAGLADGVVGVAVNLATNPEEAKRYTAIAELATGLVATSRFERLQVARRVIDAKVPATQVLSAVHRRIVAELISGATDSPRLVAVATARRLLSAGVVPRVVLERLSLEL
jgi:hypothetical protein